MSSQLVPGEIPPIIANVSRLVEKRGIQPDENGLFVIDVGEPYILVLNRHATRVGIWVWDEARADGRAECEPSSLTIFLKLSDASQIAIGFVKAEGASLVVDQIGWSSRQARDLVDKLNRRVALAANDESR